MGGKNYDFGEVAAAQGEENRQSVQDQLFANRPTMYTPWGYQSWSQTPYTDPSTGNETLRWEMTQGLNPALQDILNKQFAIQGGRTDLAGMMTGRMGSEFGEPIDWSGLAPMGERPGVQFTLPEAGDPYQTRQRAEDAVYNQAMSRIQPQQQSEMESLEIKMRNQGLSPGDAAWQSQVQDMNMRHSDQSNQALWSSVGEGRAESGQMWGMMGDRFDQRRLSNAQNYDQMMRSSNYANQLRQAQMAEAMSRRGWSLNEMNALLSGQQVGMPQMPDFMGAQARTPTPIYQSYADQTSVDNATNPWNAILRTGGNVLGAWASGGFG